MPNSTLTQAQTTVNESSSASYTATLLDETGAAVSKTDLDALTLTLYDRDTGNIINTRDGQNILDQNNATVTAAGVITWVLQPADNAIQDANRAAGTYEAHIALFEWTYETSKQGKHELTIWVQQLTKVP